MIILGIETSCDDTAISILREEQNTLTVLSGVISSQIKLHAEWGGVVPNLAAREHLKNILPLLELALREAKISPAQIDLIATTQGPGLIPALLVGTTVAKTLSFVWKKPLLGINHIEGHIYSNFIQLSAEQKIDIVRFPALCLVVSGGHTQLVLMRDHLQYEIIGETLDDAAGEAFDKVARLLNLGYPGGPAISALAAKFKPQNSEFKIELPRPMKISKDFNFSFSGLKTAVLYLVKKNESLLTDEAFLAAVCHEFQQAVVDVLVHKTLAAAEKYNTKTVLLAGGVSANAQLRRQLGEALAKFDPTITYTIPEAKYSVDNAVMIGAAASYRWNQMTAEQKTLLADNWRKIETNANLRLN